MTMLEALRWLENGYRLYRRYDKVGNHFVIAGCKCSGAVNALVRCGFVTIDDKSDIGTITPAGTNYLSRWRADQMRSEGKL